MHRKGVRKKDKGKLDGWGKRKENGGKQITYALRSGTTWYVGTCKTCSFLVGRHVHCNHAARFCSSNTGILCKFW